MNLSFTTVNIDSQQKLKEYYGLWAFWGANIVHTSSNIIIKVLIWQNDQFWCI